MATGPGQNGQLTGLRLGRIVEGGRARRLESPSRRRATVAPKQLLLPAVALALAAAGCGSDSDTAPEQRAPAAGPRGTYAVGKHVFGLRGTRALELAAPPVAPLAGWLTPVGVPSHDGRYLAYNAWKELRRDDPALSWADQGIETGDALATPSIRLYDEVTGDDAVLEDGAFSLAWRADGVLAYFKGAERDYRAGVSYVGDVFVRASWDAEPVRWSPERARYIVVGWAGRMLLGYREREGEALDVVAFDEPGRMRILAPDAGLVAISPDGRRALVEQGPAQGRPNVRMIDVASAAVVARLDLTHVDPAVGAVGYAGDWEGDRVVASSASGLALFHVGAKTIRLEQAIRVRGLGLSEPRFADAAGHVIAWASGRRGGVLVDCERASGRCDRFRPLPDAHGVHGFPVWRRNLYNPSRPLEEG
jgi:hypothetical protein